IQRHDLLGLSAIALWAEAEVHERHGRRYYGQIATWLQGPTPHLMKRKHSHEALSQPLDQSIKCIPTAKKRRTLDQGGGRDLPRFMGVTPPCFKIPNADLTTHLPQSDSTMQIFSGPQADLFQPRLALQDPSYKY
ncbi:unnamed protein product, partial [Prunus brigantina]